MPDSSGSESTTLLQGETQPKYEAAKLLDDGDHDRPVQLARFASNVGTCLNLLAAELPAAAVLGAVRISYLAAELGHVHSASHRTHAMRSVICESVSELLLTLSSLLYLAALFKPVFRDGRSRTALQHLGLHRTLTVFTFLTFVASIVLHALPGIMYTVQTHRDAPVLATPVAWLGYAKLAVVMAGFATSGLMRRRPKLRSKPLRLGTGYGVRADEYADSGVTRAGNDARAAAVAADEPNVLDYENCSMIALLSVAYSARLAIKSTQVAALKHVDLPMLEEGTRTAGLKALSQLTGGDSQQVTSWNIVKVLYKPLRVTFLITFLIESINVFLGYTQIFALHEIVATISKGEEERPYAYLMCWVLLLGQIVAVICVSYNWVRENYLLHNPVRLALSSMLFAKILRTADAKAMEAHNVDEQEADMAKGRAQIMNLLTIDVGTIASMSTYCWNFTNNMVGLTIAVAFLYSMLGVSSFVGIVCIPLSMPLSFLLTKAIYRCDRAWARSRDARTAAIKEFLLGVKVIKLNAFEPYERARIDRLRQVEFRWQRWRYWLGTFWNIMADQMPIVALVATYVFHTLVMGKHLDPATAFVALGIFNRVRGGLENIPKVVQVFATTRIALDRIKSFLNQTEVAVAQHDKDDPTIRCDHAVIAWPTDQTQVEQAAPSFKLHDINVTVPLGKLTLVAGPLGAGKTLLAVIEHGKVTAPRTPPDATPLDVADIDTYWNTDLWLTNTVAYAPQQAYVRHGTVRDNIVFGQPFWEERYYATLKQCSLTSDIDMLVDGDGTEIGEHGVNLSGGQRARVNLARCVYSRAKTIYLDDILSAVDAHTAQYLVRECLSGPLLAGRTVVLVSHHVELCLTIAEYLVSLEHGTVERACSAAEAKSSGYAALLSPRLPTSPLLKSPVIEDMPLGLRVPAGKGGAGASPESSRVSRVLYHEEHQAEGHVATSHYWLMLEASGGLYFLVPFMALLVANKVFEVASSVVVEKWTGDPSDDHVKTYLFWFVAMHGITYVLSSVRWVVLYGFGDKIGFYNAGTRKVHRMLVDRICAAPLSFFESTPAGRIMNIFGQDMWRLDAQAADSWGRACMQVIRIFASSAIIVIQEPLLLVALIGIMVVLYPTGRVLGNLRSNLRRLSATADSPLITLYHDAIDGVVMVRAFGLNKVMASAMMTLINRSRTASVADWISYNWVKAIILSSTSVIVSGVAFVLVGRGTPAAKAGFILSYALQLSSDFFTLLEQVTEVEQTFVSAERVNHYIQMDETESTSGAVPPPSWPAAGRIEYKHLSMRYAEDLPDVLHDISLTIESGMRVGVVGATGSGKSTLALSLFRGVEARAGSIEVDGLNIADVALPELRKRLNMVAQDGTLTSGTLREALDITGLKDDYEIYNALKRVHLLPDHLTADENAANPFANLDTFVAIEGANFSHGQRQLLCLARALLKQSKVLVMDEATSSVDFDMDAKITAAIKDCFADTTMIVIAHRLATIVNYDRVLVLDRGTVLEYGAPRELMTDRASAFHGLCMAQSQDEYDKLRALAGI